MESLRQQTKIRTDRINHLAFLLLLLVIDVFLITGGIGDYTVTGDWSRLLIASITFCIGCVGLPQMRERRLFAR